MGKYMRRSNTAGEVAALMDVSHPSLGVLTRAQSLALQKSTSSLPSSPPPPPPPPQFVDGAGPYLQLRSRRLQKKPSIVVIRSGKRRKQRKKATCIESPNPNSQKFDSPVRSLHGSGGDGSRSGSVAESVVCAKEKDLLVGEKEVDGEVDKERSTRESTPCSLIRNQETARNQGSSTSSNRDVMDASRRGESLPGRNLPTTHEMDEFFSGPEEEQQRQFIQKYNFDPVNEKPLPGRYEWKKVDH
ncbi:PREDICTED: cyclin-dependent kinase inhibitor 4-like [Tarenaya hassleriana]|uniref:cyclin-dependent kinase inhibitor 4-like n=1 Tax=Tarenaya hassleriana TaxID=28532 RepID=UPI00053C90E7|nr:PREDICTED: cyclin-dependent kinase inhibitor 4-like [Tarenaya hassleriana]